MDRATWKATALVLVGVPVLALSVWLYIKFTLHPGSPARGAENVAVSPAEASKSIAVLPFVNMSADKDNEYFSDGITEEILNALARTPGLRVAARTSAFWFKGKNESVQRIGAALNVSAVLEGSVQRAGNQLRIAARLVNVADGFHLWSQTFDRKAEDVFAIQTEVARQVQEALKVKLLGASPGTVLGGTDNLEAYELYLRARHHWNQRTAADVQQALRLFQQATEKDPKFAGAYAGLASTYSVISEYAGVPARDANPKARAAARRALELDGRLAEAHAVLGNCAVVDWDRLTAKHEFEEAIRLNPNHATSRHWYSIDLRDQGRSHEALAEIRAAQALDPLSPAIQSAYSSTLYFAGRKEEALVEADRALKLSPGFLTAHLTRGSVFLEQKRFKEAIAEFESVVGRTGNTPFALGHLGLAYGRAGLTNAARQTIETLKAVSNQGNGAFAVALAHMGLGEMDEAFIWLERSVENRDWDPRNWKFYPVIADAVKDPRYAALLKKFGLDK